MSSCKTQANLYPLVEQARSLDANGAAKVYIVGRRKDKLNAVAEKAKNGSIVAVQGDITTKDDLESIAKTVEVESGFVNGASVSALDVDYD